MTHRRSMFCLFTVATLAFATISAAFAEDGYKPIFDGQSLKGWSGNPEFWRVEDGAITGQTTKEKVTKGNTFLVWQDGKPSDFDLKLKFRIDGGNSGIQYRSKEVDKWVIGGYQADFDSANGWTGSLYHEKGRGVLAKRGKKVKVNANGKPEVVGETTPEATIIESIKKDGGWNDYRIVAKGNHIQQWVNGHLTIDLVDEDEKGRAMSGLLALQVHAGPPMKVQFKDIELKEMSSSASAKKKVVFVAGPRSHGTGQHEHNAGCLLLARHLHAAMPGYQIDVHSGGWPKKADKAFEDADTVIMFCDGGGRHVVMPHLDEFDKVMDSGTGLVCIHYGVEVPKGPGGEKMLKWMGGYFEPHWSVNPHWKAKFTEFPNHPITNGVGPFEAQDEWYFHMRFRDDMQGVTPILTAIAPEETMKRGDGAHSGNPDVRRAVANKTPQHMAWAAERDGGGRGFGFTGAHFHNNWADDNFRRVVLNAIVWTAHDEVPAEGVDSTTPSDGEIQSNLDR